MHHVDRARDASMEICITLNSTAASMIKHGFARRVDVAEGLNILGSADFLIWQQKRGSQWHQISKSFVIETKTTCILSLRVISTAHLPLN